MDKEVADLLIRNRELQSRLYTVTEAKDAWRFWALVGLGYSVLLMAVVAQYRFF